MLAYHVDVSVFLEVVLELDELLYMTELLEYIKLLENLLSDWIINLVARHNFYFEIILWLKLMYCNETLVDAIGWQLRFDLVLIDSISQSLSLQNVFDALEHVFMRQEVEFAVSGFP